MKKQHFLSLKFIHPQFVEIFMDHWLEVLEFGLVLIFVTIQSDDEFPFSEIHFDVEVSATVEIQPVKMMRRSPFVWPFL